MKIFPISPLLSDKVTIINGELTLVNIFDTLIRDAPI